LYVQRFAQRRFAQRRFDSMADHSIIIYYYIIVVAMNRPSQGATLLLTSHYLKYFGRICYCPILLSASEIKVWCGHVEHVNLLYAPKYAPTRYNILLHNTYIFTITILTSLKSIILYHVYRHKTILTVFKIVYYTQIMFRTFVFRRKKYNSLRCRLF